MRNKNTIEFIGIWEQLHNPRFNSPEFEGIKNAAGLNRCTLSVKKWIEKTSAVGMIAKTGRYGGTYAHKDIAFGVASESEARSLESYYCTKFFRCFVSLRKLTQDALRPMYSWVPVQAWDRQWTDEVLYKKYKLTAEEIGYIEAVIRPMEVSNE